MHFVNQTLRLLSLACAMLAAGAVGVTAAVYVAEVVARYGFNSPLNWSGDIGSYMLCASVFLAVPLVTRQRRHIAVTVVLDVLPPALSQKIYRLLELISASVLLIVAYFVLELSIRHFQQGVLTTMANQIPRWWLSALMTLSLVLATLNFLAPADPSSEEIEEI